MICRGRLQDSDKFVYGACLHHPVMDKYIIIEPRKDIKGKYVDGMTFHIVDKETIGAELKVWQREGFKRRKFYEGDVIDEGDNFPSIIRFGENDINGYGFYLEEVQTENGCTQPKRHTVNAYTTFPDKTKVISQTWKYVVGVDIAETPDGEFVCRNEYEKGLLEKNCQRLHNIAPKFRKEKKTISELDNGCATSLSVEYYKE